MIRRLILALFALLPLNASASEQILERGPLAITLYGGDLALVKERRIGEVTTGESVLAFPGVSARLQPVTARLQGDGISVVEQVFHDKLITKANLLAASVGRTVGVARINPATGEETVTPATVLAVQGGVVLEMEGKVRAGVPGNLLFDGVPEGLRARPTLTARVTASEAGRRDLELSYLTGGLSWRADYVAVLDEAAQRIALETRATLTNTSGTDYPGAALKLVAGEVRAPKAPRPQALMEARMAAAPMADMAAGIEREALAGYHLYSVARPVDLLDGQTLQVALIPEKEIAARRELVSEGPGHVFSGQRRDVWKENPEIRWSFDNTHTNGLGLPLPAGTLRAFERDTSGELQFVGADQVRHTPDGGRVTLRLGKAFDVRVERTQTDYARRDKRTHETAHRITVANGGDKETTVRLVDNLPGEWTILEESAQHTRLSAGRVEWRLAVPAGAKVQLRYRVRNRF